MPTYDMCLIMRAMPRNELVNSLQKAFTYLMGQGGIIRKIESYGERQLPQKANVHDQLHTKGQYMIVRCDIPYKNVPVILEEYGRNRDVIRRGLIGVREKEQPVCTLEDELKPPTTRPSVQQLIKEGRKPPRFRHVFRSYTGLDYYPFHR